MKVVLCTGGFDPVHSGHISYFEAAKKLGDVLVIGLNSDEWLTRKKGRPFMSWQERCSIIQNLRPVSCVIGFNDSDGSATEAINEVLGMFPNDEIIFANGGDRTDRNIPEMENIYSDRLTFEFGVGGEDKKNSSSWILENWQFDRTHRVWGFYDVLRNYDNVKIKELVVDPGRCLSYQRHEYRNELWFVREGMAGVVIDNRYELLSPNETVIINANQWHQLSNPGKDPLSVIEIQYGEKCEEDDIERA